MEITKKQILSKSIVQNGVASVMVGLGPGLYMVMTSLGAGGGPASAVKMQNVVNSILYAVFFLAGFVSGSIVNTIGPKYTFMLGSLGYPVYVGGLWYFSNYSEFGYPVFGGVFLGFSACLLWTAAGYIAFSYALEGKKGFYISMQWGVFGLFSTIASLVAFGINYSARKEQCSVAVYVVFICIMASGFFVSWLLVRESSEVCRSDGSSAMQYPHKGFWVELKAQITLVKDWRMMALTIPFFGSEVALTVISTLSASYFNIRTRTLNSVMFNVMQMVGSAGITLTLDTQAIGTRRTRGLVSIAMMGAIVIAGWIGLIVWLHRNPLDPQKSPLLDWTGSEFGGFLVLDLIFGLNMVIYQVIAQWIAASLTNDPYTLARYAGYAKGCLAGGLAVAFGVEASEISQMGAVALFFSLQAVGILCMVMVCWICVKPTSSDANRSRSVVSDVDTKL